MEETLPSSVGGYAVEKLLGKGSYGRTFMVFDRKDKDRLAPYALKWLLEGAEPGARGRFDNEIWALQHLDHQGFPKFVQSGAEQGRPFIVMGFAEGRTIGSRIGENEANQTFFTGLSVLLVAERLLEALCYLNDRGLMHRDIKDDNVIISSSGEDVALIDLGLIKGHGVPAQDQTFWNAGAGRFAPPAKLENPADAVISHDVFAVGVLCYHMLTNHYPWQVGTDRSVGDLKRMMLEEKPPAIQEFNNAVDDRICQLVMRMISVRDYARVTLDQALGEVKALRTNLETAALPLLLGKPLRLSRVIRDPVHGDIQMTDLEFAALNCREMQRLRRIRQLGTAHLVYPGAEHTRLAHAVGVVHIVERILRAIEMRDGYTFSDKERWTARLSALIHDVAHAPFGHTLEDELGFYPRHDRNEARMGRLFGAADAELPKVLQASPVGRAALDLIDGPTGASPTKWIESLLSGSVGADVLDYVDRDSFYCGLDSRIDSAIYRRFTLESFGASGAGGREILPRLYGSHGFRLDADYAVLSVMEARYALFMKVYSHPVKTAAGAMIGKALTCALLAAPQLFSEESIEVLGDEQLLDRMEIDGGSAAARLVALYRSRKLFRPAFRARIMQEAQPSADSYRERQARLAREGLFNPVRRASIEAEIARDAGVDPDDIILYASPKAPGAKSVSQRVEEAHGEVALRDSVFARHQEVFSRHLALWSLYVFVRPDLGAEPRSRLSHVAALRFGLKDELRTGHKQLALEF